MKTHTMIAATFALAIPAPVAFPTAAVAAANPAVEFCKAYVAAGYDANLTVGNCVALLTTESHYYNNGTSAGGFAAQACNYVQNNYPGVFDAYYGSLSECVQDNASAFI